MFFRCISSLFHEQRIDSTFCILIFVVVKSSIFGFQSKVLQDSGKYECPVDGRKHRFHVWGYTETIIQVSRKNLLESITG